MYVDWWSPWTSPLHVTVHDNYGEICDICGQEITEDERVSIEFGMEGGQDWAHSKCVEDNHQCKECNGNGYILLAPILDFYQALLGVKQNRKDCESCQGRGYIPNDPANIVQSIVIIEPKAIEQ